MRRSNGSNLVDALCVFTLPAGFFKHGSTPTPTLPRSRGRETSSQHLYPLHRRVRWGVDGMQLDMLLHAEEGDQPSACVHDS